MREGFSLGFLKWLHYSLNAVSYDVNLVYLAQSFIISSSNVADGVRVEAHNSECMLA